jgi:hypothetical protein
MSPAPLKGAPAGALKGGRFHPRRGPGSCPDEYDRRQRGGERHGPEKGLRNGRESSDRTEGLGFGFWCWTRWPKKVAVNYREDPYGVIGLAGAKDRQKACGRKQHTAEKGDYSVGQAGFSEQRKAGTGQGTVGVSKREHRRSAKQRFT